jgi:uncharacterized protein YndB with AHSA1/START domain
VRLPLTIVAALLAAGCATTPKTIPPIGASHGDWVDYYRSTYPADAKLCDRSVRESRPWPEGFDPDINPVFTHNEIVIQAPPARVFAALVDANRWAEFYENARDVKLLPDASGATPAVLGRGTHFAWTTFGASLEAEITEYEPDQVLAWTCRGGTPTIAAHHRWLLFPQGDGTRLVTEECNKAEVSALTRWIVHPLFKASGHGEALPAAHQQWLRELKARLEKP